MVLIDREVERPTGLSAVLCDHGAGVAEACAGSPGSAIAASGSSAARAPCVPAASARPRSRTTRAHTASSRRSPTGPSTPSTGGEGAEHLLRLADPPTALIAGSNQILPGLLEAVRSRPDVAVVTFDGDSLLESIGRPVGVIYRQSTEIGRAAAGLLLERFEGHPPEERSIPSVFRAPRPLVVGPVRGLLRSRPTTVGIIGIDSMSTDIAPDPACTSAHARSPDDPAHRGDPDRRAARTRVPRQLLPDDATARPMITRVDTREGIVGEAYAGDEDATLREIAAVVATRSRRG